jgi:hypothetical protein
MLITVHKYWVEFIHAYRPHSTGINPCATPAKTAEAASMKTHAILETLFSLCLGNQESIAVN